MKTTYLFNQSNYLPRTAIGREQKQFIKIAFAVHLSAVISAERYRSDSGALKSAVFNFVFFVMLKNKIEQSAKTKLLLNNPTDRTFGNRWSRYKEPSKNKAEAYLVYVEHLFLRSDAGDARIFSKEEDVYGIDYGFGLDAPKETEQTNPQDLFSYRRNYTWTYKSKTAKLFLTTYNNFLTQQARKGLNEKNLLTKSSDKNYTVHYRYGEDGQRALKYTEEGRSETLYFNNFFTIHIPIYDKDNPQGLRVHKHIFVGNSRLVTAMTHTDNHGDNDEQKAKRYYYHSDHLGSAQFVTDWRGRQYEHIEYTPYGELWIEEVAAGIDKLPFRFTGKELDEDTGLYYYGARYLDPKYSRWLSGDPALNDYIPKAPIDDEAKKHNENLPGMGGVFNVVNLHVYHYAGNNPVKYVDPDGREIFWVQGDGVSDQDFKKIQNYAKEIVASNTEAGKRFAYLINSKDSLVVINVKTSGDTNAAATNWDNAQNGKGSDTIVNININDIGKYKDGIQKDLRASLVHEISGHAYSNAQGTSTYDGSGKSKKTSREQWMGLFYEEQKAVAMENEYRNFIGLPQRAKYQNLWDMPLYNKETNSWFVKPGEFDAFGGYRSIPGGAAERWK
ncbi:RHS repeat domain-containing protein [Treponema pedis]|uniref:RHS repeat domain-containing protein n=1 Tax=Treponema pedis TaxID=409322 RepID=UPI001AF721F6|nr:RHS repeat-associated core domain-containing protein [Treponema pedis]QSI04809.1 RHS repeat-associated core domain-containing protein [Treponema pedis]